MKANRFYQISNTDSALLSAFAKAKPEFVKKFSENGLINVAIGNEVFEAWMKHTFTLTTIITHPFTNNFVAFSIVSSGLEYDLGRNLDVNATLTLTPKNQIILNSLQYY